jgi:hypothetical protein
MIKKGWKIAFDFISDRKLNFLQKENLLKGVPNKFVWWEWKAKTKTQKFIGEVSENSKKAFLNYWPKNSENENYETFSSINKIQEKIIKILEKYKKCFYKKLLKSSFIIRYPNFFLVTFRLEINAFYLNSTTQFFIQSSF